MVKVGVITFVSSWIVFFSLYHKGKFPLYIMTCYIGVIFAMITDLLILCGTIPEPN